MSRLLTTLLLYRSGFYVGKYISLEAKNKDLYYDALGRSQDGWHKGMEDAIRELCPSLSISSIEGALRKLVKGGELERKGSGKKSQIFKFVNPLKFAKLQIVTFQM